MLQRHLDVQKDDVGLEFKGLNKALLAIDSNPYLAASRLQHATYNRSNIGIIINNQSPNRSGLINGHKNTSTIRGRNEREV